MKPVRALFALLTIALLSAVFSTITGVSPGIISVGLIAISLIPTPQGALLTAIKVTDLNTKLGAYLRDYKEVLIAEMLLNQPFENDLEVWDDVTDEVPMPNLSISDLVKPGLDPTFSATADALSFDARTLKVRDAKVDLLLVPTALHKTWLGKFRTKKGKDVFDMPFEQFVMNYIIEKVQENIHLKALFKGVYNASGTTPTDTMNGFLKIIADEITATKITPIVTGVITSANVADKLLAVYDGLGEAYKQGRTQASVSPQIFDWYARKFSPLHNASIVASDVSGLAEMPLMNALPLHGTNCIIKRQAGLAGSQRIIITPRENMVFGTDSMSDFNNIEVQRFDRTLKLLMDFRIGAQFKEIQANALAVNEQA